MSRLPTYAYPAMSLRLTRTSKVLVDLNIVALSDLELTVSKLTHKLFDAFLSQDWPAYSWRSAT